MATPTAVNAQITDAAPNSINPEIIDSIAISSLKSIADQPAILSNLLLSNIITNTNLSQQNAVSNQQAMNQLGLTVLGKSVNLITTVGPIEAMSVQQVLTGNTTAEDIAALKAAVGSLDGNGGTNGAGTATTTPATTSK